MICANLSFVTTRRGLYLSQSLQCTVDPRRGNDRRLVLQLLNVHFRNDPSKVSKVALKRINGRYTVVNDLTCKPPLWLFKNDFTEITFTMFYFL